MNKGSKKEKRMKKSKILALLFFDLEKRREG